MALSFAINVLCRLSAFVLICSLSVGYTADQILARAGFGGVDLPPLFQSASLPYLATEYLADGSAELGRATAVSSVLKQPLSGGSVTALARATAKDGTIVSTASMTQAGALGWRNVDVQVAVIEGAVSTGQWRVAGPRIVALTKLNQLESLDPAIFSKEGAPLYASYLASAFENEGLAWFSFAKWLRSRGLLYQSRMLLAESPPFVREEECVRLGVAARSLINDGEVTLASALVQGSCLRFLTPASTGLKFSDHFADKDRGPFEWQVSDQLNGAYRIKKDGDLTVVVIINNDPLSRPIASKVVSAFDLRSIEHLFFQGQGMSKNGARPLNLDVHCIGSRKAFWRYPPLPSGLKDDCDFYSITFYLPSGQSEVWYNGS